MPPKSDANKRPLTAKQREALAKGSKSKKGHGKPVVAPDHIDIFLRNLCQPNTSVAIAALEAGFSEAWGYRLLQRPENQERLKAIKEQIKDVLVTELTDMRAEIRQVAIRCGLYRVVLQSKSDDAKIHAATKLLQVSGDLPVVGAVGVQVNQKNENDQSRNQYVMPPPVTHDGIVKAEWLTEKREQGKLILQRDWDEFLAWRAWKHEKEKKQPLLTEETKDGTTAAFKGDAIADGTPTPLQSKPRS